MAHKSPQRRPVLYLTKYRLSFVVIAVVLFTVWWWHDPLTLYARITKGPR